MGDLFGGDREGGEEDVFEGGVDVGRGPLSLLSSGGSDVGGGGSGGVLHRGLSVNVNGAPWKRVLMRMNDSSRSNTSILLTMQSVKKCAKH